MSLPKLTSLSTQTLSLILERQRFQTLPSSTNPNPNALHLPQLTKNLASLRSGILDLEAKDGRSEAVMLLRDQYERMRSMLGDVDGIESLEIVEESSDSSPSTPPAHSPPPPPQRHIKDSEPQYAPYTDDPEAGYDPGTMLHSQQMLMTEQDDHLDQLSHSINRQHHVSLQINDELDVHTGLLQQLDTDLDYTESRLTGARRRLERVARGAKENGSTVTIGVLILVLLILIIVFKT